MTARSFFCLVASTLAAASTLGCRPELEVVRSYTIPKQTAVDDMGGAERMLAAAILQPAQAWFFKLVGPEAAVEDEAPKFIALVKSLRFKSASSAPDWKLPDGWHELPGTRNRYATLETGGHQPLEVSVTMFPRRDDDDAGYLLANVNRWRKQIGAGEITAAELERERQIDAGGTKATLVDLVGRMRPAAMGGPFADGAHPPVGPDMAGGSNRERTLQHAPDDGAAGTTRAGKIPKLHYETPAGWHEQPPKGMRLANFTVGEGPTAAELTVVPLGNEAGDLAVNVNRWRGQIGLAPIEHDAIESEAEPIDVGPAKGTYIRLVGAERSILAVLYPMDDGVWFITLKGGNDLVAQEVENFKSFVHSLTIEWVTEPITRAGPGRQADEGAVFHPSR